MRETDRTFASSLILKIQISSKSSNFLFHSRWLLTLQGGVKFFGAVILFENHATLHDHCLLATFFTRVLYQSKFWIFLWKRCFYFGISIVNDTGHRCRGSFIMPRYHYWEKLTIKISSNWVRNSCSIDMKNNLLHLLTKWCWKNSTHSTVENWSVAQTYIGVHDLIVKSWKSRILLRDWVDDICSTV